MKRGWTRAARRARILAAAAAVALAAVCAPCAQSIAAAAAPDVTLAAEICAGLGLLRGDGETSVAAGLSKPVTRLQAIYITVRLAGREAVAASYKGMTNFKDANLADAGSDRRVLAYVKANPWLGWSGTPDGKIDPTGYMSSQAMYKVLLMALDYETGLDFTWNGTIAFARSKGMDAIAAKRGYLTNRDVAEALVEALKTRMKGSLDTLCEHLAGLGVVGRGKAAELSMLPGSAGYVPLRTYNEGGPLLVETTVYAERKTVSIRFNTELNPTYAKALKCYNYYLPGAGYIPLPSRCATSMADERTVVIKFPGEGWMAYSDDVESDAFTAYIAGARENELRVGGLYDVDGNALPSLFVDVPQ